MYLYRVYIVIRQARERGERGRERERERERTNNKWKGFEEEGRRINYNKSYGGVLT